MTPGGSGMVWRLRRSGEFLREACATTFDDDKKNGGSIYREAADETERLVMPVAVAVVRPFIEEHHYSKSINGCKVSMAFALYEAGEMVGAVLFGPLSTTAWKRYGEKEGDVVERGVMPHRAGARGRGLGGHQSAKMKNDEWLTPPEILAALGGFDLDPCAPVTRPWDTAAAHYTVADDGLALPWRGRVWCNPPFGREAVKWLAKLRDHGNGIALIPARTETAMFYATVWGHAAGVLFLRGRPHFHFVDGRRAAFNSGAPIALVAYGAGNLDSLQRSRLGFVVVGHNVRGKAETTAPPA